jgi:4,5-DOPA dioxygenase extradiol
MMAPALFVAHGAPTLALAEDAYTRVLQEAGDRLGSPAAILVCSAHWQAPPPFRFGAAGRPGVLHDFGGFPDALYRMRYDCPGSPDLSREAAGLLEAAGIPARPDDGHGLDHGAWVPLRFLRPRADVPVVPMSLAAGAGPGDLMRAGAALGPLRERGVVVLGTGGVVHNLRRVRLDDKDAPVEPWAAEFDAWVAGALERGDVAALREYRARAPHAALAAPTSEHFDPLFVVLGAALPGDRPRTLFAGFQHATLSMRSFLLAP